MRKNKNEKYSVHRVLLSRKVVVPPNTELSARAQFSNPSTKQILIQGPEMCHKGILIPYALVSMETDSRNLATCNICIRNDSNRYVHLRKGHVVGRAEEIDCVMPNCKPNLDTDSSHCAHGGSLVLAGRPRHSSRSE